MDRRSEGELDEFLLTVMETVAELLGLAGRAVLGVARRGMRHPVLLMALGCLAVASLRWSVVTVTIAVLVGAALLGVWRVVHSASFAQAVGRPSVAVLRATFVYRPRWERVAVRHGLVTGASRLGKELRQDVEVARLLRVRSRPGCDRLLVRLPVGMAPIDLEKVCSGISHSFRVQDCRVRADRPGRVWLELRRRDLLASVVTPLPVKAADPVDLAAVPVGRDEDGSDWCLRLEGTHLLIAGATGAGKGSVLWSLLSGLAPDLRTGRAAVWAIDPKGGMELRPGDPLFERFEHRDTEAMCRLLEDLVEVKDQRAKDLAGRGLRRHAASTREPHIVLLIDELATLTAFGERTITRRIEHALGLLLTQGRACGISIIAAVQDPGKDVVAWRDLFPTRLAMRLDNPIQVDMVLGEGARDRGALADEISELTPGVAYVRIEGTRELRRVRSAYLDDAQIRDVAARFAASPAERRESEVMEVAVPTSKDDQYRNGQQPA